MATNSWTYATRDDALADLSTNTSARARALAAMLAMPELASVHGGAVVVSVADIARPDGGVALQCVVQQHAAAPVEIPAPDTTSSADTSSSAPPAPA